MDGAGVSFSFASRRSQKSLKTCKYRGIKILIACNHWIDKYTWQ